MRFVYAIVAFILAAVMVLSGIAQRTVFLGPSVVRENITVSGDAPYLVIDGDVLTSYAGQQSLSAAGTDDAFVGYGRTDDVMAWLGESEASYDHVSLAESDGATPVLETSTETATAIDGVAPNEEANPDPRGSDLWLSESSEVGSVLMTMNVPDSASVIVASNGVDPVPSEIGLSWPVDNSTPWAGPLVVGGLIFLLIGIALYVNAFIHTKRSQGPRRRGIIDPAQPKHRALSRGRSRFVVLTGVGMGATLLLAGCSSSYWPDVAPTSTPSESTTAELEDALQDVAPPALTSRQLERIVLRVSDVAAEADQDLDRDRLETRFADVALESRSAEYDMRRDQIDRDIPEEDRLGALTPIPASPVQLSLPQAVEGWPRTVLTVVNQGEDPSIAPTALVLSQDSPRTNYTVRRVVQLEPEATFPDLPPATLGTSLVPPDSSFLTVAPNQVAEAYADLLSEGADSEWAEYFAEEVDTLRENVSRALEEATDSLGETAELRTSIEAGDGTPVAFATLESGALVSVDVRETNRATPTEDGVTLTTQGGIRLLSGVEETETGIQTVYGDQLLFHVPPAGSDEKITLLGFNQGLLSAEEIE